MVHRVWCTLVCVLIVNHTMLEKQHIFRKIIYEHIYGITREDVSNAFYKHQKENCHSSFKFIALEQVKLSQRFGNWKNKLELKELKWQLCLNAGCTPGLNNVILVSCVLEDKHLYNI